MVDSYVYLGTTIQFNGKFKEAIQKQINQAHRALFVIKSKMIIIETRMVCFWHKILTGLNKKLSYRLLYLQDKLNEQNNSPFAMA